jgi:hypothetical protein
MVKSETRARKLGLPVRPLYEITASYRTPSGKASHATYYLRCETMQDYIITACVNTCANPRRHVARGVDGITVTAKYIG